MCDVVMSGLSVLSREALCENKVKTHDIYYVSSGSLWQSLLPDLQVIAQGIADLAMAWQNGDLAYLNESRAANKTLLSSGSASGSNSSCGEAMLLIFVLQQLGVQESQVEPNIKSPRNAKTCFHPKGDLTPKQSREQLQDHTTRAYFSFETIR